MAIAFPGTDGSDDEEDEDEEKYGENSNDLDAQARYFGNAFLGRRLPPPVRQRALCQEDSPVPRNESLQYMNSFYKLAPLRQKSPEDARRGNGGPTAAARRQARQAPAVPMRQW